MLGLQETSQKQGLIRVLFSFYDTFPSHALKCAFTILVFKYQEQQGQKCPLGFHWLLASLNKLCDHEMQ